MTAMTITGRGKTSHSMSGLTYLEAGIFMLVMASLPFGYAGAAAITGRATNIVHPFLVSDGGYTLLASSIAFLASMLFLAFKIDSGRSVAWIKLDLSGESDTLISKAAQTLSEMDIGTFTVVGKEPGAAQVEIYLAGTEPATVGDIRSRLNSQGIEVSRTPGRKEGIGIRNDFAPTYI